MPTLGFAIDITGYVEEVAETRSRDIPFATAKALTRTAQDAQIEVKRGVRERFTLRNDWTQRNIKIKPAEKLSFPITAEVYTDTGNNSAPDYLEPQEDGGDKVPHDGHTYIAIPTKQLREIIGNSAIIPAPLRPKELLAAFTGTHVGRRSKKEARTPKAQQFVGFKQELRGKLYIFARRPEERHEAIPFYLLTPEANIRAVLDMEKTVERIAEDRFDTHWDDAWAELGD